MMYKFQHYPCNVYALHHDEAISRSIAVLTNLADYRKTLNIK